MRKRRQASQHELSSIMSVYYGDVGKSSVLSPSDERDLAVLWKDTGDTKYADRLVAANLRFVIKVALEYRNYDSHLWILFKKGT